MTLLHILTTEFKLKCCCVCVVLVSEILNMLDEAILFLELNISNQQATNNEICSSDKINTRWH